MAADITVHEAARLLSQHDVVLVDVREDDEWREVRAPGALHLPMGRLASSIDQLPTDRRIACICHLGGRSAAVAEALAKAGYDVVNVVGGMDAWQEAGLPVEHG